ncbi:FAD/NAD(P)-binding protein [Micromonospora andamanensis]|uniref:FAD/NAD(P)-binding protein n=1 Tax=Micromonospora andamanensis TaxID=1287068 RepID=UPI00194EDBCB|nr:FAD/NAD(P)-binding protein [Micromonospora andamanensis]
MTSDRSGRPIRLAIVGGGPTCTYVLERLAALIQRRRTPVTLDIVIFDLSGEFGPGQVHSPRQTVTSYLNRIVGQVAFAADESVIDAGPLLPAEQRPTLLEWCRAKYAETGDERFNLVAEDWPKRYLHGLALRDQFDRYVEMLRAIDGVTVTLRQQEVVDLAERSPGFAVLTSDGAPPMTADYVLMLTGHSSNRPELDPQQMAWARFAQDHRSHLVHSAYPLEQSCDAERSGPGTVVGCMGMGLTGIDVILYLTEGRGGTFERDAAGKFVYRPSGAEPEKVVAFSRTGLFTFARPYNQKEVDVNRLEYKGRFFTIPAVARLRETVGVPNVISGIEQRQLDFQAHLLPLIQLEMALIFYSTLYGDEFRQLAINAAEPDYDKFLADADAFAGRADAGQALILPVAELAARMAQAVDAVLTGSAAIDDPHTLPVRPVIERFLAVVYRPDRAAELLALAHRPAEFAAAVAREESPWRHPTSAADHVFTWDTTINPIARDSYSTPEEYQARFLDFLDRDIRWAAQGNLVNPAKAAADAAWRDLRSVVIEAVDFGGLRASSHRAFLRVYTRHHNRLCQGASCEAMEKVTALVEAGYVDISVGPDATVEGDPASGRFRVTGQRTGAERLVDVLIDARVHPFDAERDVMPIYPNLLRRGIVRKWRNPGIDEPDFVPGGLDLTREFHPVRADGTVESRITFLGPPSEGVMYHQIGALRPNKDHHVIRDILCWIRGFLPESESDRSPDSESDQPAAGSVQPSN